MPRKKLVLQEIELFKKVKDFDSIQEVEEALVENGNNRSIIKNLLNIGHIKDALEQLIYLTKNAEKDSEKIAAIALLLKASGQLLPPQINFQNNTTNNIVSAEEAKMVVDINAIKDSLQCENK